MNIKNEYLDAVYPQRSEAAPVNRVKTVSANPIVQIVLIGTILTLLLFLSINGHISSSFVYALGNTLIYSIVAIGFCLLLGYSGLASLGTAGGDG